MYGFHKIKNGGKVHEFKLEGFRRGNIEQITKIKRKASESADPENKYKGDCKVLVNEYNRLEKGYIDLSQTLNVLANQNRQVTEKNKELVVQIYLSRKEYELRMKKLIFLFFVLMENYTPELLKLIKSSLAHSNLLSDKDVMITTSPNQFKSFINKIVQRLIFSKNRNDYFLDNLLGVFSNYITNGEHIDSDVLNNYQNTIDAFLKDDKILPIEYKKDKDVSINDDQDAKSFAPLNLERNISFPDNVPESGSLFEGLSMSLPSRRETVNFSPKRNGIDFDLSRDHFSKTDIDSINMFSPRNDKN